MADQQNNAPISAQEHTPKLSGLQNWLNNLGRGFERHWLAIFNGLWGVFVTMPFVAPILMAIGLTTPARGIYFIYNFFCHQLPERSWFLFGPQFSYTKEQIGEAFCKYPTEQAWFPFSTQLNINPEQLVTACQYPLNAISSEIVRRQFIGTPDLGWKVTWSDRMVSMYTSIFIFGVIYAILKRYGFRFNPLHWALFLLLIVPLAVDGTTHLITDALRLEFRNTNAWAAILTGSVFAPDFYAGDALGSINSWLRIISGLLFGFGVVGFLWPIMDDEFQGK
ncbi:DUF2085 domain-containing protein [Anaerolineales bacterium HSG25]|nr:DUF2085 domain-containing protein [Anaerolineales bacterium HSG25]